ncbi:BppU family phage baseplate upper protein [Bacillus cereus group sp. BY105LC]|uniref:BppU family phage baseplate upper protein n=1 Tax=Bacillus cereus group sp. BY105LC TaxID=3018088 RepID=UPI0022E73F49|nr:BppU family phage baseplate upper protein [Bacillus cereus group sp. BY105LC]MDA1883130.1 BppU family phage baseplate upper protein [Bacillus cereus group sp. BY105LC]
MTFKTYEINVDLVHDTSTTCSNRFSQNDRNSAKLLVTITNKGAELDLSQAKSVRMSFKKPDGTRVFQNDCQPINAMKGKYQIVLKTQTLTSVGNVIAQIHIEEEDRIIDTQKFFFVVNDSLASDEAVESTNEFTIIQKAIEAGKKLEGVDINGIIAAGELAKGALPKSGGTMTGNVDMDISVGSKSKGYRWRDATGALFGLESATDGALILYDYKNLARVWQYDPVAKRFTVLSDTNLLKTTGGTITGTTIFEAGDLRFKNAANDILFRNNTSGIFSFYDIAQNQVVWSYNPATKEFTVNSASNLLKKTGDTMTGDLKINKIVRYQNSDDKSVSAISVDNNGRWYNWSDVSGKRVFMYDPTTDTFTIDSANTNLLKNTGGTMTGDLLFDRTNGANSLVGFGTGVAGKRNYIYGGKGVIGAYSDEAEQLVWRYTPSSRTFEIGADKVVTKKDGRATLTLTADATQFDTTIGSIADRRGNTVTLKMAVKRNVGGNEIVCTLPPDVIPLSTLTHTVLATDGTPVRVTVGQDRNVRVHTEGKNIYLLMTYVVD